MKMQHITEIDALKAKIAGGSPREVITLKTELQLMVEQRETLWKEIDALKAENERLRQDAERYRFLRSENSLLAGEGYGFCVTQEDRDESGKVLDDCWIGTELDMVLDTAMSALPISAGMRAMATVGTMRRQINMAAADDKLRKMARTLLTVLDEGGNRAKAMQDLDRALEGKS